MEDTHSGVLKFPCPTRNLGSPSFREAEGWDERCSEHCGLEDFLTPPFSNGWKRMGHPH